MVHSTGINTSDSIRMSCIQDFTRVKPRKNIMWSIEGGSHSADGVVTFAKQVGKDDGERCVEMMIVVMIIISIRVVVIVHTLGGRFGRLRGAMLA